MKITKQMLLDKKACSEQVELFVSLFGEEVTVTKANCLKAWKARIDFNWAAYNLLTSEQGKHYGAIEQQAYEEYGAIQQPAWGAYLSIQRQAYEKYEAIKQQAYEEYNKQCALAFYTALKG